MFWILDSGFWILDSGFWILDSDFWLLNSEFQNGMKLTIQLSENTYAVDLDNPMDISIPVVFNGDQPGTYSVPKASAKAYEDGKFIGDTRRGGGCNFEEYRFVTHCNGTHTECVGHIALERISVHKILTDSFIAATVITVVPENALKSTESYEPDKQKGDQFITAKSLFYKLQNVPKEFLSALIIRTMPNETSKKKRNYMNDPPPFFSMEAMDYIAELDTDHLLTDLPSVDRSSDDGKLCAHHIFWALPQGSHDVEAEAPSVKTITEMIYVPDAIPDGNYFLNLQIASFVADAAPSRPILFNISTQRHRDTKV